MYRPDVLGIARPAPRRVHDLHRDSADADFTVRTYAPAAEPRPTHEPTSQLVDTSSKSAGTSKQRPQTPHSTQVRAQKRNLVIYHLPGLAFAVAEIANATITNARAQCEAI
jgi:hypothetical protein